MTMKVKTWLTSIYAAGALLGLTACSGATPTSISNDLVAGAPAALNLIQLVAKNNTSVQKAVNAGALFCQSPKMGAVVAAASTAGGIISVVNATAGQDVGLASQTVAGLCQQIDAAAVPVSPPANPGTAPVAIVPNTPPAAVLKPTS